MRGPPRHDGTCAQEEQTNKREKQGGVRMRCRDDRDRLRMTSGRHQRRQTRDRSGEQRVVRTVAGATTIAAAAADIAETGREGDRAITPPLPAFPLSPLLVLPALKPPVAPTVVKAGAPATVA